MSGKCCDKCPAGEYMEQPCSDTHQTSCKPCPSGFFSDQPSFFDRCEECRSCKQEYSRVCTPTTDAECSCGSGFLCSDDMCSTCEKGNSFGSEKLQPTVNTAVGVAAKNLTENSKKASQCQNHEYFDKKKLFCIPITQCSAHNLIEIFAGNKTHNAICQSQEIQNIYIVVFTGFAMLLVAILVVLSYHLMKKIKKIKDSKATMVTTDENLPLPMEETSFPENNVEHFG
uniref:TNFR-Cys domain-containing protein n=1 Tax=Knipowitschia caucasica TaxID=637954 RepID=A0AAV2M7X9_KNICA